jgi:hypothetical protein
VSGRILVIISLLAAGAASHATGQVVRGTLVEHGGAPLPGGAVILLDSAGSAVDSTSATAEGRFVLRAPGPGLFSLHFSHPGYASVPSDPIRLSSGDTVEHHFAVPLISGVAIQRMSEVIDLEQRLQTNLTELCGEPPRLWEAGILVGVVRRRPGDQPLAGAIVTVAAPGRDGSEPFRKATITSANGVYVICNVPAGSANMRTELGGYRVDDGPVDVRAGEVGWYDISLRRAE